MTLLLEDCEREATQIETSVALLEPVFGAPGSAPEHVARVEALIRAWAGASTRDARQGALDALMACAPLGAQDAAGAVSAAASATEVG